MGTGGEGALAPDHISHETRDEQVSLTLARPWLTLFAALMTGIVLGAAAEDAVLWLMVSAGLLALAWGAWTLRRDRMAVIALLMTVASMGAAWQVLRSEHVSPRDIVRYVQAESQLAQVRGYVDDSVRVVSPNKGAMGRFSFYAPHTVFTLAVERVKVREQWREAHGRLLVRVSAADTRVQPGMRIEAIGWLGAIDGPRNPGEFNFQAVYAQQGVYGRLTLPGPGNWRQVDEAAGWGVGRRLSQWRGAISDAAAASLRRGMVGSPEQVGLLEAILLGRREQTQAETTEAFRDVGLAHLLAISGAHLGILMGLIWLALRLVIGQPRRVALLLLAILGMYLLAIPLRPPIVRAAIMAGLFCVGVAAGRRLPAVALLAMAAIVVLVWRPSDLFSPGFQLSFGVVAALLMFTRRFSHTLVREPLPGQWTRWYPYRRRAADCVAVSVVAYAVALPIVAYHFQMVSPLGIVWSLASLPPVTAVLGLGYLKIAMGLLWPSAGLLLAWPLAIVTDVLLTLVYFAASWPGAAVTLSQPPSVVWVMAALLAVVAWLGGRFVRRRGAMVATVGLLILWAGVDVYPAWWRQVGGSMMADQAAVRVNMLAVGDGSCYLVRVGGKTILFDCGSQAYFDVGVKSVVPALRKLGVDRIDMLMLSHADIDHYCGSLDVIDALPVAQVLMPPQMLAEAEAEPHRATGFLIDGLRSRGLKPTVVTRGWRQQLSDGSELKMLWPPADFAPKRTNDTSLVLAIEAAGRRVLLNGDIQDEAVQRLLAAEPGLTCDVMDLPHHGSFTEWSDDWLRAMRPAVVLQSCGPARLRRDPWAELLLQQRVTRLITAEHGMVEVSVDRDGKIHFQPWRRAAQAVTRQRG